MVLDDTNKNNVFKPDPYYSERYATFGDRLCAARETAGLSQKLLASKMGVKSKTVQAWESDAVEPRANKLQMVSALLNVSMVWLMSGLGSGISPPEEQRNTSLESDMILTEIKAIRLAGESLSKRITLLEEKIVRNLNLFGSKSSL
jgi:transcriptional regulator with XRE-family HTH domain